MYVYKIFIATIISLSLFIGGIILMLAHIPFWSMALGIAATQIGIVFFIFTYERLSHESAVEELHRQNLFDREYLPLLPKTSSRETKKTNAHAVAPER